MNLKWRGADQLASYKRRREVEFRATENISLRSEQDSNPRRKGFKSGALTTRPFCLLYGSVTDGGGGGGVGGMPRIRRA